MGILAREAGLNFFALASWHLFMQSKWQTWLVRWMGAFSIYREGMDRHAMNTAIDILADAQRPLIVFPEGAISRTNDRLTPMMDDVAFMARSAAKKRAKAQSDTKVVIHPVALRYYFTGNIHQTLAPVLDEIETRLSWQVQRHLPLIERITKVGKSLLCLKEIETFGDEQSGSIEIRLDRLIDHLLVPVETRWLSKPHKSYVKERVKRLRSAILPDMVKGDISDADHDSRWRQLAGIYLAQQLSNYPPDYIRSRPTIERLLETVERFEEDLTDAARPHHGLKVVVQVGDAIDVPLQRDRHSNSDPLMSTIEQQLQAMLGKLTDERVTMYEEVAKWSS